MKKLLYLSAIAFLFSCDKIDNPNPTNEGNAAGVCTEPVFPPNTYNKKNILVEDFTGHYCNNCPGVAYSIDTIKERLGKQLVPVGIHVTDQFAAPVAAKAPKFQTDFRVPGGEETKDNFAAGIGLPAVMVSRKDGFTSTPGRLVVFNFSLPTNISSLENDVPKVRLQTVSTFDPATSRVCTFAEVELLEPLPDDHSIVFMLLEDSIIDYQLYNGNGGNPRYSTGEIPDYVHKHVLRRYMNGWQGKTIISGGELAVGDKVIEGSTFVITESSWQTNHLEVVAFLYNNATKEVIQSYSEKL